jgi:hypothetical protein
MDKRTVKGVTYHIGQVVVYDSEHGWKRGIIKRFGGHDVYLEVKDAGCLQKIRLQNIQPSTTGR